MVRVTRARLNAYILVADPAWLRASVSSYYPYVDRLIVCFDRNGVGWSGTPIDVDSCLRVLGDLDVDRKVVLLPGNFSDPSRYPLDLDTAQRQIALDAASDNCDWVLQVDTDEVIPDWECFSRSLSSIEERGHSSLWYPQRWLFSRFAAHWYFEPSRRLVRTATGMPGPMAVRPGATLVCARQDRSDRLLLEVGRGPLHIPKSSCVLHFSWVRSSDHMLRKSDWSGHSRDFDWAPRLESWRASQATPVAFQLRNVVSGRPFRVKPAHVRRGYSDEFVPYPLPVPLGVHPLDAIRAFKQRTMYRGES